VADDKGTGREPEEPTNHGRIEPVDLQSEMARSYLDYAMSVIVSRSPMSGTA
jgi:DNA gyrase/topoisomerase IV subunit A